MDASRKKQDRTCYFDDENKHTTSQAAAGAAKAGSSGDGTSELEVLDDFSEKMMDAALQENADSGADRLTPNDLGQERSRSRAASEPSASDAADLPLTCERRFQVLCYPHMGLQVQVGTAYSEADLIARCCGDAEKLRRLRMLMQDLTVLLECGPAETSQSQRSQLLRHRKRTRIEEEAESLAQEAAPEVLHDVLKCPFCQWFRWDLKK